MSFYDWYCDLPPASPQVWGEQTDVPESADWFNSTYIIAWGSNVPQTRTPDAHFFTEVRYKGAKTVAVTPDYSEVAKLADLWMHPKQGTDAAVAMAMGHVVLREFFFDKRIGVLRRLRAPVHRPADARHAEGAGYAERRDDPGARPLRARIATSTASWARPTIRNGRRSPSTRTARWCCRTARSVSAGAPTAAPTRASGTSRRRRRATASDVKLKLSVLEGAQAGARHRSRGVPVLRRHRERALSRTIRAARRAGAHGAGPAHRTGQGRREARGAGRHRVRPAGRELRRRARTCRRARREGLRRRHALHAGLAGGDHRRAARAGHHGGAPVRRERATRRTASRW